LGYHIFEINAFRQMTHLQSVPDYRAAKTLVNEHRRKPNLAPGTTFRLMFAENKHEAERLLKEKRDARPMGEHD